MLDSITNAFSDDDIRKIVYIQRKVKRWLNKRLQTALDQVLSLRGTERADGEGSEAELDGPGEQVIEGDTIERNSEVDKVMQHLETMHVETEECERDEAGGNEEVLLTSVRRRDFVEEKRSSLASTTRDGLKVIMENISGFISRRKSSDEISQAEIGSAGSVKIKHKQTLANPMHHTQ